MSIDPITTATAAVDSNQGPWRDTLSLIYQEILTVVTRLRASRQAVMDATSFRTSMKAALAAAEADAVRKGYTREDARLAAFAVVAFLDESIENLKDPSFAEWCRRPLQEELFGEHTSGEIFYQCADRLLARSNSQQDADVLEVFGLSLLLGYRGRYAVDGEDSVQRIASKITKKVESIRGAQTLAPDWAPVQDGVLQPPSDPWVKPLMLGTVGALFLAILFFVGYKFALMSGAAALHSFGLVAPH